LRLEKTKPGKELKSLAVLRMNKKPKDFDCSSKSVPSMRGLPIGAVNVTTEHKIQAKFKDSKDDDVKL
jgi:hypothetical protein